MKLDLRALANAIARLSEVVARCSQEPADEQLRDGLIQRFEFTYELSHNIIRGFLREAAPDPDEIERMPFAGSDPHGKRARLVARRLACLAAISGNACAYEPCLPPPYPSPVCGGGKGGGGSRGDTGISRRSRTSIDRIATAPRMSEPPHLDIEPGYRRLVLGILAAHLPAETGLWVFGSRASGRPRRYFDLDLLIDAGRPLTLDEMAQLSEAFRESDLPYGVDLVDWHGIDARFRQTITATRARLLEVNDLP